MTTLSQSTWLDALIQSLEETVSSPFGDRLPGFPSEEWQLHTVGLSGIDALREASAFMEACVQHFQISTRWSSPDKTLLDFGTGWGRIARCFMREFKGKQIIGTDINPTFLGLCKETFEVGRFLRTEELPPLRHEEEGSQPEVFPENGVDFIVAYSVFSHLSEEAGVSWINEFNRILRPGGMLAVTTRGRWFFDTAEALKELELSGYAKGLSEMFEDFNEARARYDEGLVVHATNSLIGDGKHYGETFIPEAYARKVFSENFNFIAFHEDEGAHPIIILQKRP